VAFHSYLGYEHPALKHYSRAVYLDNHNESRTIKDNFVYLHAIQQEIAP
jgi:hypothetical protein